MRLRLGKLEKKNIYIFFKLVETILSVVSPELVEVLYPVTKFRTEFHDILRSNFILLQMSGRDLSSGQFLMDILDTQGSVKN